MSFWSTLGGSLLSGLTGGLFNFGSNVASAKMEYSQTKEGQERQFGYNKQLNKQQYKYQKKLNADQYGYQTKLNKTALDYQRLLNQEANSYSRGLMQYEQQLTTAQNQWNATQLPSLTRQGYVNAGINPMLAIGASANTQMIPATGVNGGSVSPGSAQGGSASGSSVSGAPGANFGKIDLLNSVIDAYRAFKLDSRLNNAEVKLKEAQTEKVNEEKRLLKYDKPLKVIGDVVEDIKSGNLPPLPAITSVTGQLANTPSNLKNGLISAKQSFKSNLSKAYWKANDYIGDKVLYFDHLRRYGREGHPSWNVYDGNLTRYRRIKEGVYHYKQQKW